MTSILSVSEFEIFIQVESVISQPKKKKSLLPIISMAAQEIAKCGKTVEKYKTNIKWFGNGFH